MNGHRFHPHTIDHSFIFHEDSRFPQEPERIRLNKNKSRAESSPKWLERVAEKLSRRLFTFETKNLKLSL